MSRVKIYQKTSIIIAITFIGLIVMLYGASVSILLGGFAQVEGDQAQANAGRMANALANDITTLDDLAFQWASREDLHAFLSGKSTDDTISDIDMAIYQRLGINYFLIFSHNGTLRAAHGVDFQDRRPAEIPESLLIELSQSPGSVAADMMGLLMLPEGPLMVVSRPVSGGGGTLGAIVVARHLDKTEIDRLSFITSLPVEIIPYSYARTLPLLSSIFPELDSTGEPFLMRTESMGVLVNAPVVTRPLTADTIGGYALVRDVSGNPAVILRATMPRVIYAQGEASLFSFILFLLGGGCVFGILMVVLLRKSVLSRLSFLSTRVQSIGLEKDFAARVDVHGDDEVAGLATAINGMLTELEYSQLHLEDQLIESEERYRRFFHSWNDILLVHEVKQDDTPGRFIDVNDAGCERLGYDRKEILQKSIADIVNPEDTKKFSESRKAVLDNDIGQTLFEIDFITRSGENIPMEVNAKFIDYMGKTAVLSVARDISERREIEKLKMEAFKQIEKNMEQFAVLNDHIRNPLQAIVGLALIHDENEKLTEEIIAQAAIINEIVDDLDTGWIESEKIRGWLRRYYKFD